MQENSFQDIAALPDNQMALLHAGGRYFFGYRDGERYIRRGAHRDESYRGCRPCEFRYPTSYELRQLMERSTQGMK